MISDPLHNIERKWKVKLPSCFPDFLQRVAHASHVQLSNGQLFALPFHPLRPEEIVSAFDVAADWDLPSRVVPVIGDFHDLICLNYRKRAIPSVIALDDDRNDTMISEGLELFITSLTTPPESPQQREKNLRGIIESKSWLDF